MSLVADFIRNCINKIVAALRIYEDIMKQSITEPFDKDKLLARIKMLLRRSSC